MRIIVWGLGYVGTVSAACLAQLGHEVVGVEPNAVKVEVLNAGRIALKEPGLEDLVRQAVADGRLRATNNGADLISWADVSLICVGTPSNPDGSPVLDYIQAVTREIGAGLRRSDRYHVVALRSTVFPGIARHVVLPMLEEHAQRTQGQGFDLVVNPEFMREATAVADFHSPPYTIIGELNPQAGDVMAQMYAGIAGPVHRVTLEEAELLKLTNNAFHALKIGFANEIGRLCDQLGMDSHSVMRLVCADSKLNISPAYLQPGFAFGGSCLPKDLRSLVFNARRLAAELPILESVLPSNYVQVEQARRKIHALEARRVAVLGLSFKPNTDDLRESPIIHLIQELWRDGVDISVYDPDIRLEDMLGTNREYMERQLPQAPRIVRGSLEEALEGCQAVIVSQKRPEFIEGVQRLPDNVAILDLVRIDASTALADRPNYKGIAW
jgi:GDP-mannose 6-dehydrogenase